MSAGQALVLAAVFVPWAAALAIFALGEARERARALVALAGAGLTALAALVVGASTLRGAAPARSGFDLLDVGLALRADALGVIFAGVAAVLWLVTTVYALGYMAHAKDRARFFGFFAICVGSATGIALSANLLTLFVFYEVLTLATYPLVVHSGTPKAIAGGRTYLVYALTGGVALALGVIWLAAMGGGEFAQGGSLAPTLVSTAPVQLTAIFALLIAGFGVKAALFPAHEWLPAAMVAPAPVSALLHAVAVVKAGVFGIARVVLHVYGTPDAERLGLLLPLTALAAFTLLFASVRALSFDDIKKRLAYSTVGQLSYIVLGLAVGVPLAAAAAIAHLVAHAVLKITMFFTAGVLAEELGVTRVSRMGGAGRRMPMTMTAFSVAALGIIGIAPVAGFVSKWGLGAGALSGGDLWPVLVLAASGILNAAYLLPMIGKAWFEAPAEEWPAPSHGSAGVTEADGRMVWPLVLTSAAGLVFGVLAGSSWAPSTWAAAAVGLGADALRPWDLARLSLDAGGVAFLALAGVVWAASALASWGASRSAPLRFRLFFAIAAASSLGLAFARDAAAFYACFSAMALSAWALVVDDGTPRARAAGRAYLALTVLGEALLFIGLLVGATGAGPFSQNLLASPWFMAGTLAIVLAFAMKTAALGLGGWMPLAYAAVSRGSGAALAGVVSSAGVLGLVRFAPGGVVDLWEWGVALVAVGLASAFLGALAGVLQREARHVLAYSSVSQFGLMWVGVGVGLAQADLWPAAVAAVAVYLLHHGLAKAALFAGDDAGPSVRRPPLLVAGLALPALALAGTPLSSGALAKIALKSVAAKAPTGLAHLLEIALPLAAVGTTLLMARFLHLAHREAASRSAQGAYDARGRYALAFALLVAMVGAWAWIPDAEVLRAAAHKAFEVHYLWVLAWPVAAGLAVAAVAWTFRARVPARVTQAIPPGDVWAPLVAGADRWWSAYQGRLAEDEAPHAKERPEWALARWAQGMLQHAERAEAGLLTWGVAGTALAIIGAMALVLVR